MNLAQLVVNCIKENIRNDDTTLNVENLLNGNLEQSPDYAVDVNNVLLSINKAISRLQTAKKIPLRSTTLVGVPNESIYDISHIKDIRKIVSVYVIKNNRPYWVGWNWISEGNIFIGFGFNGNIYLQYEKKIPNFLEADIQNTEIDLEETYGLDDELCNYIAYFAKSELYERVDQDRCKRYLNYFEQFVNEIDRREAVVYQDHVQAKYKW